MIPKHLLAAVLLACLCCARPGPAAGSQDFRTLYGTWRWVETIGELLPARGTPQTCQCARLLLLGPGDDYRYFWPDSSGGFLLAEGGFTTSDVGGRGQVKASTMAFTPSFDSKRHSLPKDEALTLAGDTLLLIATVSGNPPSHVARRFVRGPDFAGKVPAPRAETPSARGSPGTQRDSLSIPPASITPRPFEDPPVPISVIETAVARWLRGTALAGNVRVKALVAADGRVKDAEVTGLGAEEVHSLLTAVKRWVFKPALMSGRPVASWVEIPFQSGR